MYLPTLTNEELLRYAGTQTLTPLEAQLVQRLTDNEAEGDGLQQEVERLEWEVEHLKGEIFQLEEKVAELESDE